MDTMFYKIVRPIIKFLVKVLYRPEVEGLENIPEDGKVVLAGNHTRWLDPPTLISTNKRQVHFLAKIELFKGLLKPIMNGFGCIPVNRKIHDKGALSSAIDTLNNNKCIGIFPEGTINRTTDKVVLPFKIGAVKMAYETNATIVPFVITGKYKLFRKSVKIKYLKPIKIKSEDLTKENERLMDIISKELVKEKNNGKK